MRTSLRSVGLTGGIGSGKSTIASLLAFHGAVIVDTDAIARELTTAQGAAMPAIRERFGSAVISADGALNRDAMRTLAFSQPESLRQLESILHPMIGEVTRRRATQAGDHCVVFDVPLLVESSRWRGLCERVLVVDCLEQTQVERVMRRSGWTEAAVRMVISKQATREQRRRAADAVIYNEGLSHNALTIEVAALVHAWQIH